MDLTYCKSQRRKARANLRNYLVANLDSVLEEFDLEPISKNEMKNMSAINFSNWVMNNAQDIFKKRNSEDLINYDIIELVAEFICCENNVTIAESENNPSLDIM